jgi:hypothetical protein
LLVALNRAHKPGDVAAEIVDDGGNLSTSAARTGVSAETPRVITPGTGLDDLLED